MDFPITSEKIKTYAEAHSANMLTEVRTVIKPYMQTNPSKILDKLKKNIDQAIRLKSGTTEFKIHIANLTGLLHKYKWDMLSEVVLDDYLTPLFNTYFPTATYAYEDANVYIKFSCPEISSQTSNQ